MLLGKETTKNSKHLSWAHGISCGDSMSYIDMYKEDWAILHILGCWAVALCSTKQMISSLDPYSQFGYLNILLWLTSLPNSAYSIHHLSSVFVFPCVCLSVSLCTGQRFNAHASCGIYIHILFLYEYVKYLAYMPKLVGIFVSSTYLVITQVVEDAVGCGLVYVFKKLSPYANIAG